MYLDNFFTSSTSCMTNSRVGTMIKILGGVCVLNLRSCSRGIMKAKVFPVPVCEIPITFFPERIMGKAST